MALTKIPRGLLDTGIADSSDATAITIDSSENVTFAGNILKTGDLTLDVSGDFIFDADEAVSNTDSDSAKVLQATIDGVVSQRLGNYAKEQESQTKRVGAEKEFRAKHEMSDDKWQDFVKFANSRSLSLDDIYYLMNRQSRDKNVAQSTRQDMAEQMKRVRQKPQSASSIGGAVRNEQPSQEDQVFNAILGIDSELESVFGR